MTEPSLFWVDPNDFSLLLKNAGVGSTPGAVVRQPVRQPVSSQHTPRQPASSQQTDRQPTPQVAAHTNGAGDTRLPPFTVPEGSFEDRLLALLDWVHKIVVFEHGFVVDQEGLALVRESAPLELIAASGSMSELWESLRNRFDLATQSYLAIDLGQSERLHLLAADSPWGLLSLGFVSGDSLSSKHIDTIQLQFQRTLKEEGAE